MIQLVVLAYTAWQSLDLWESWKNTPHMVYGEWAFLVWIVPLFLFWSKKPLFIPLTLAIAFTLAGNLGSLRALKHLGLAFAVLGNLKWNPINLFWLATSIGWMPASGYIGRPLTPEFLGAIRIILTAAGTLSTSLLLRKQ